MTIPIRPSEASLIEVRQALQRIEMNRRTGATHNFTATAAPTVNDDESAGYSATSMWYWPANDFLFICTDATKGGAQWYNPFDGAAAFGQGGTATAGTGYNYGIVEPPDGNTLTADGKGATLRIAEGVGMKITGTPDEDKLTFAVVIVASSEEPTNAVDGNLWWDTTPP